VTVTVRRPKLAVWKFASCDGCQLSLLNCEDELLALAERIELANFAEASSTIGRGPYDLSLVEGSITTPADAERIHKIRRRSKKLAAIGACATAGGLQALRNHADLGAWAAQVYPSPEYLQVLAKSTPIRDHVQVDFELRGCPIRKEQLLELVAALLAGRPPRVVHGSVCLECKARDTVCLLVARGVPCLGPITLAGCGALCPAYGRGCYGCFGPMEAPNTAALMARWSQLGVLPADQVRALRTYNVQAPAFQQESELHARA
jgi:coenzyme F420-reducing hydrogenase gamma subunit